jgi:hypothetical protein
LARLATAREREQGVTPKWICDHCGRVIGVYEPMVVIVDGQRRDTSRAADQLVSAVSGPRFHRDCYAESSRPSEPAARRRRAL